MCIGYEARCIQKRVPGVFSNPKESWHMSSECDEGRRTQGVGSMCCGDVGGRTEPWAWALFSWVRDRGVRPAWASVSVVDDTSQTLRDEVEYLWDLRIHALRDDFKVLR